MALIFSQQPNESLNGKITCDWLIHNKRKLHFGFENLKKIPPLMKKYEDLPRLWLRWRFSEDAYRVWVVNSWRHTRVRPKWDEDGVRKMDIHRLVRMSINRSTAYLRVSNELWKWEFFEIRLGQNERKWQREFPKFQMFLESSVLWVSDLITSSFRFLVLIKLHTFLLTWTPVAADKKTLNDNFGNAYLNNM